MCVLIINAHIMVLIIILRLKALKEKWIATWALGVDCSLCNFNPIVLSLWHFQNDSPVFLEKALEAENFMMGPVLQLKDYWQLSHSPVLAPGTENVDPNRTNQVKTNILSYAKLIHWIQGTVMPLYMGLSPCQLMLHHICVNLNMGEKKEGKYFPKLGVQGSVVT